MDNHRDGSAHIATRLIPDEGSAPLVTRAFHMRAELHSHISIHKATALHKSQISYGKMLRNAIYIGRFEYGELAVDDYCSPLIDRATWDAVQLIEAANATRLNWHHPRSVSSRYLLSGLVRCGLCGGNVTGKTEYQWQYYHCKRYPLGDCTNLPVKRELLEQEALAAIRSGIDPAAIYAVYEEVQRQLRAGSSITHESIERKRAEMRDTTSRIRRITAAIAAAGHSSALLSDLISLEQLQRDQAEVIAKLEQIQLPGEIMTLTDVTQAINSMIETAQGEDFDAKQRMVRSIIQRVTYSRTDRTDKSPCGAVTLALPWAGMEGVTVEFGVY
jgi:hypothetical protein